MFILKWIKAKKNGIPLYIKDKRYNYRAMMTESEAKTTKVIATYVIIGIHEESRNKDWLYAYDWVNVDLFFVGNIKKI